MAILEVLKDYLPECLSIVVDVIVIFLYYKLSGKGPSPSISKLEKKVAKDYEKLKADESLLEQLKNQYKEGD